MSEAVDRRTLIMRRVNRTNVNDKARNRKLGASRGSGTGSKRAWTQREDRMIRETAYLKPETVARLMGRTKSAVCVRRSLLL